MTTPAPRFSRAFLERIAPRGYTPLPNALIADYARKRLSMEAIKVVLYIARWSLGEGEEQAQLTDDEFIHGKIVPPGYVDRGLDTIPESFLQKLAPYTPLPHQVRGRMANAEKRVSLLLALNMARYTWGESKEEEWFTAGVLQRMLLHLFSLKEIDEGLQELRQLGLVEEDASHRWKILTRLD